MDLTTPSNIPSEVICDTRTGYALNVPLIDQEPGIFWIERPALVDYINERRAEQGIVVMDDGIEAWKAEQQGLRDLGQ
jgi:hypothetical protein